MILGVIFHCLNVRGFPSLRETRIVKNVQNISDIGYATKLRLVLKPIPR